MTSQDQFLLSAWIHTRDQNWGGAVGGPCFNLQHQQTVGIQPYSLKSKLPWKHSLAYWLQGLFGGVKVLSSNPCENLSFFALYFFYQKLNDVAVETSPELELGSSESNMISNTTSGPM